jgi:hypothetical protein
VPPQDRLEPVAASNHFNLRSHRYAGQPTGCRTVENRPRLYEHRLSYFRAPNDDITTGLLIAEDARYDRVDVHFCTLRCFKSFFGAIASELKKRIDADKARRAKHIKAAIRRKRTVGK